MSSKKPNKKKMSSVPAALECAYCLEVYDDPRNLPCGHTFCFKCLQKAFGDSQPQNDLQCCLCRKAWQIPSDGLADLPKNYVANNFRTLVPPASECVLTEDGVDHGPVEYFCIECWEALCKMCRKGHRMTRLTRDHKIKPVRDLSIEDIEEHRHKQSSTCNIHRGQEVVVYCTECKEVACTVCCVTKHTKHECVELEKADSGFVEEITEKLNQGRKVEEETKEEAIKIKKTHLELVEQQKTMSEQVKTDAEEVRRKVRESCETILQRIDFLEKKSLQKLNKTLNDLFNAETEHFKNNIKQIKLRNIDCESLLPPASCSVERAALVKEVSSRTLVTQKSRLLQENWNNYLTEVAAMMKHEVIFTPTFISPPATQIRSFVEQRMFNKRSDIMSVCNDNILFSLGENIKQLCVCNENFTVLSNPVSQSPIVDAILLPNGNILCTTDNNVLVMSQDSKVIGTTPMSSSKGISANKRKDLFYLCAGKSIYRSSDDGTTWKKICNITDEKQVMHAICIKDNIFWVIELNKTSNTYLLSEYLSETDNTISQRDIDSSGRISARSRMAFDFDDILYVSDFNSSAIHMYRTTNRQYMGQLLSSGNSICNPIGIATDPEKSLLYINHQTPYTQSKPGYPNRQQTGYAMSIYCYRLPWAIEGKYQYSFTLKI